MSLSINYWDKPCASKGFISYRYKGRYGYIMIGAYSHSDALNEVRRSTFGEPDINILEIYCDIAKKYINVNNLPTNAQ